MKKMNLFFLMLSISLLSNGQFLLVTEGPVFQDPGDGFAKIIQMRNNSTMFIHINFTKGLFIHVYDSIYRARTESTVEPVYGKLAAGKVEGIFEIKGDAVIFISDATEKELVLYRLLIDGRSGKLKEEKRIASIMKSKAKKKNEGMNAAAMPGFHVRKDPGSDNYAVAMINEFQADTSKRIEVVLYNNEHRETKRAYYASKTEKFKYLQFIDMAVMGPGNIALLNYAYNTGGQDDKEGDMVLSGFDKTPGKLTFNEMSYSNNLVIEHGIARYEPETQRLLLLVTAKAKSESGKLNSYLAFIDPVNRRLESSDMIGPGEKVTKAYAQIAGGKEGYRGVPQNLVINRDGGFTIIFEEMEPSMVKDTVSHLALKNMAVVSYDNEARVTNSYLIPMDHDIRGMEMDPFYQADRELTAQPLSNDNQFKPAVYISDGRNSFVLYNDIENNTSGKAKPVQLKGIDAADAFYYPLKGNDIFPKPQLVFGKPSGTNMHNTAIFSVSDYDKANNIFVTIKPEKNDPHPGIKLVWLQP